MLANLSAFIKLINYSKLPYHKKNNLKKRQLKKILVSAYLNVPYYREMMKEKGYDPQNDYKGPEDLKMLPITKKKALKSNDINIFLKKGTDKKRLYFDHTSGSTGIPLKIFFSYREKTILTVNWLRMLFLNGYKPSDRYFTLTAPANSDPGFLSESLIQRLGLFRKKYIFYPRSPKAALDAILDYSPHVIYGTRSYLDLIASELISRNIKPKGLKFVISGEEVLTGNHRLIYSQAFGTDIIDAYGAAETTMIAHGIRGEEGLNICDDIALVEFLDENDDPVKNGEIGRVIVTSLVNFTMPFIRYELGDRAKIVSGTDKKGTSASKISMIYGRDNDSFILPDGSRIFYHDFYNIIFKNFKILQFQAIRKFKNHIILNLAADLTYFKSVLPDIRKELKKVLSEEWTFEIHRQDFIRPDSSGKLRMLISDIGNEKSNNKHKD